MNKGAGAPEIPEHKRETKLHGLRTAREAIRAAGITWTVAKVPKEDSSSHSPTASHWLVRRDRWEATCGNEKPEGVLSEVGADYVVQQCEDVFAFFDPVIAIGGMYYDCARFSDAGKKIWLRASLGEDLEITPSDRIACYVKLSHSYELYKRELRRLVPNHPFDDKPITPSISFCPVRLLTGLEIHGYFSWRRILGSEVPSNRVIRVSGIAEGKPTLEKDASAILQDIRRHYEKLAGFFRDMAGIKMNDDEMRRFAEKMFLEPLRTGDHVKYEKLMAERQGSINECSQFLIRGDAHPQARGTLWQHITEFLNTMFFAKRKTHTHWSCS